MQFFLTGGTGFIGSHFIQKAYCSGHAVRALCRAGGGTKIPIDTQPTWQTGALDDLNPHFLYGCDAVVHLASHGVSPRKAEWQALYRWNVAATIHLLQQAKAAGVKRIVLAGTCAEYGRAADQYNAIPPTAPLLPTSGYAASKAAAFMAATAFAIEHNMELAYLRIFSAYGEGQYAANFWPALRRAAIAGSDFQMTKGEQVRDYVAVETVACALVKAAERTDLVAGNPWVRNLGSGQPTTMKTFAEKWWAHWGAPGKLDVGALPYRSNEVMRFVPLLIGDELEEPERS